ncbi:DNA gyrase inhibitor YacG [Marinobacteraceae bacterium S3BR75-40.1]
MSDTSITVQCPTCKKDIPWSDEYPYRPFCSERCRKIDLGSWADESFRIPGEPVMPEDLEDVDRSQQEH